MKRNEVNTKKKVTLWKYGKQMSKRNWAKTWSGDNDIADTHGRELLSYNAPPHPQTHKGLVKQHQQTEGRISPKAEISGRERRDGGGGERRLVYTPM